METRKFLQHILEELRESPFGFWLIVIVLLTFGSLVLWQIWKTRNDLIAYFKSLVSSDNTNDLMHFINLVGSLIYILAGAFVVVYAVINNANVPDGVVTIVIVNVGLFTGGGTAKTYIERKFSNGNNVTNGNDKQ